MITELTIEHIKAYVDSRKPNDFVGAPLEGHFCLGAQTMRYLENIPDEHRMAVTVSGNNTYIDVRGTEVDIDGEVEDLLDEFDTGEWIDDIDTTRRKDPGSDGGMFDISDWVTRAQLEASGILPWIVPVAAEG